MECKSAELIKDYEKKLQKYKDFIEWVDWYGPEFLKDIIGSALTEGTTVGWTSDERFAITSQKDTYINILEWLEIQRFGTGKYRTIVGEYTPETAIDEAYQSCKRKIPAIEALKKCIEENAVDWDKLIDFATDESNEDNLPEKSLQELFVKVNRLQKNYIDYSVLGGAEGCRKGWLDATRLLLKQIYGP